MTFIVASFYTVDTGYEKEAKERLIPSLERFGIPRYVVGIASKGPWARNIYEKASVIRDAVATGYGVDVVWLDADAEVVSYPKLFNELKCDFAAHWRQPRGNLSSGTMFFRNNFSGRWLLDLWWSALYKAAESGDKRTEQQILEDVLKNLSQNVKSENLPLSYSTIFDGPQPDEPVVIRHHQASRRYRNKVAKQARPA